MALAAAACAALPAHAWQAPPAPSGAAEPVAEPAAKPAAPAKMQSVEVRGNAGSVDPRRDDTASKIVLNHDEIVKYGDTTVLDVLKRLPGVTVSGAGGRGGEVRMRGLGSGYTQVLINGERAPAGFSIDSLAPDVIERIEVLRAASAEFSTQSIAGTINIVLKKAIRTAQREIKAGLGGGQGMMSPSLNVQLSDRAGKLSYSLSMNAQVHRQDRVARAIVDGRDSGGNPVLLRHAGSATSNRFAGLHLAPRLNWTLENGDTLTSQWFLGANRFEGSSESRTVTLLDAAPHNAALAYPNVDYASESGGEHVRSDLNWVRKLGQGARLDLKLGLNWNANQNRARQRGFEQPHAFTLLRTVDTRSDETGANLTGKYTTPIMEGHALAAGWDGGASARDELRTQGDLFPGRAAQDTDEQFAAGVKRLALYAQDEWSVTPRWSVYLGARWETIRTRSSGSHFETVDSRTSVWSPLFHTLWKLPGTKGDQVRLALTRTYKAPAGARLIARRSESANNSEVEPDYRGNPNLGPELALGIDASYEHYWAEGALLSVSTSMRRIEGYTRNGLIFDTGIGRDLPAGGRWVSLPVNDGNATTRGLELEVKLPLKAVLAGAPALDLRASVSRNWSSVDAVPGPYNRLDQQTPLSATLGIDYKGAALSAGGSFSCRSGGPVRVSVQQSSYSSTMRDLEAYALWKFDPRNQLRLTLSNLLSRGWLSETTYTDENGSLRRSAVNPGHIGVRATLEMKF